MDNTEKLKILTGESDEVLLSLLLEEAKDFVLTYTGRSEMIAALEKPMRDLAVIACNRMGTEGENSRSGSGESYSFDNAPKHIYDILNQHRLVRVGGRVYEAEKKPNESIPSSQSDS